MATHAHTPRASQVCLTHPGRVPRGTLPNLERPDMLTLTDVLAHHGIVASDRDIARLMSQGYNYGTAYDYALTDAARDAGIIRACRGCGTVTGVAPGTPESDRCATRDAIDWTDPVSTCCPDADDVMF